MQYDITIIGGGIGGYVPAIKAAQMGAKVCLIEKGEIGGTCLNRGCIPTKALLKSSGMYNTVKIASAYGIEGIEQDKISTNIDKIIDKKNKTVTDLRSGIKLLIDANKIDYTSGKAEVHDSHNVVVGDTRLQTKKLIIATGAVPAIIPIDGLEEGMKSGFVITSNEALDMRKLPEKISIIGGGVIGVELATFFNSMGVQVTIIEMLDRIIPTMDEEISDSLKRHLITQGINILTDAKVKCIKENAVIIEQNNLDNEVHTNLVILAVGRVPYTEGIKGLSLNMDRKAIVVNDRMETSMQDVYAVGDVNGKYQLAHVASAEGIVAVENALGKNSTMKYDTVPQCIYTSPQIASVGMTEKQAINNGFNIKVGKFPMFANTMACIEDKREGFAKVIYDREYGGVLGLHLIGENVTEMILGGVISLDVEATIDDIAKAISPHPSISETITEAANAAIFKAIHI